MRYTYDDEADALYVYLREVDVARSVVVDEDRVVDVDQLGEAVGLEFLGASEGIKIVDLVERFRLQPYYGHLRPLEAMKFRPREFA